MHKKTTFFGRLATTAIHFLVQKTLVNTATFFGHIGDLANGDPLYKLRPRVQFLFSSPPFFLLALFIPKVFFGLTGKANLPFGLFFLSNGCCLQFSSGKFSRYGFGLYVNYKLLFSLTKFTSFEAFCSLLVK